MEVTGGTRGAGIYYVSPGITFRDVGPLIPDP